MAASETLGTVQIWDTQFLKLYKSMGGRSGKISCMAFNMADTHIVTGGQDGWIIYHNITTGIQTKFQVSDQVSSFGMFE